MKEIELERTFLPIEIPAGVSMARHRTIDDLYIPESAEHPIVRIRKSEGKFEITKKVTLATDKSVRTEETIPLSEEEYAALATVPGKRLVKTRYYYEEGGVRYEFGVYAGGLEGLVLVDIEFRSSEEASQFLPPAFLGKEVTAESFTRGGQLAGKRFEDIAEQLQVLGYNPLTVL